MATWLCATCEEKGRLIMDTASKGNGIGLFLLGLCLAVGLVVSSLVVSRTLEKVKPAHDRIRVKGVAEKRVISDIAVWKAKVVARASLLKTAYGNLEHDTAKVLSHFRENGIQTDQIDIHSVSTNIKYKRNEKGLSTNEIEGYVLEQIIELVSDDVNLISRLSKESTSLIKEGVEFISYAPEYYLSEFAEIKIQLIGEATKNAKLRADQFAENSGLIVGSLRSATQGVFQVTPVHSTEVSGYGRYDTSTLEKSVKAVVTIEYSILKE